MPARFLSPDPATWTGRQAPANDYWFQKIQCVEWSEYLEDGPLGISLIGYAVDEGVRRNQGRVGAAAGPLAIRTQLAKLANHLPEDLNLYDLGDISCPDGDLEKSQQALADCTAEVLRQRDFPVLLGGGHDIAYAHYKGAQKAFPGKRIGYINFDAHFDLRPDTEGPNSGTPFFQLAREARERDEHFPYLVFGIQLAAATPSLLATVEELDVDFKVAREMVFSRLDSHRRFLDSFLSDLDAVCLTIDLDGFSSAYAPGVSAPNPMGFSPEGVFPLFEYLAASGKLISLDIAELNPAYDQDTVTAKLAARCVAAVVNGLG
ncbi:formimidoylglutamase [Lewinellaceae bacterium SD302]|nr:formimidoylglutamase [Lewinellaceae bacterium SD302]